MRNRIGYKLILVVAVVSATIIGGFSYLLNSSQHEALISHVEHNAQQLSETIKSGTKHDMLLNLPEGLHNAIDTIGRQEGIEAVRIFNKDGAITYSSERATVGTMVDKRAEACYACHAADRPLEKLPTTERTRIFDVPDGSRRLGTINPIYNEAACWEADCHAHPADQTVLGVLDVTMSLAEVDRVLAASRRRAVWFTLTAVLALGAIIWLFIENLVGQPAGRLVAATQAVAAGDLTSKLDVRRNDELGRLAKSFDAMTHRLAEMQGQLYQSDKLASLGRLAAGVAHEINNPLTGVLTYSSFLLKRATDDSEARRRISRRSSARPSAAGRSSRGCSTSRGRCRRRKTTVGLEEVIERSLGIVNNRLSFDNIAVDKQIEAKACPRSRPTRTRCCPGVHQPAGQRRRRHRFERGGKISITACVRGNADRLPRRGQVVADTGCGIAPERGEQGFRAVLSPPRTVKVPDWGWRWSGASSTSTAARSIWKAI